MNRKRKTDGPLGRYRTGGGQFKKQVEDAVGRIERMLGIDMPDPIEKYDEKTEKAIAGIYENIKTGRILLYPALAGTRYNTGEYIFMYDDLYDLLLRYGYDTDIVEKFIERFWRIPTADGLPIVMMSRNKTEICDDDVIKPIK